MRSTMPSKPISIAGVEAPTYPLGLQPEAACRPWNLRRPHNWAGELRADPASVAHQQQPLLLMAAAAAAVLHRIQLPAIKTNQCVTR